MFTSLEEGIGLDIIVWLQANSTGFLDTLATFLDLMGGSIGYLVLLPIVYWSVDRELGRRLLIVLTAALFLLIGAKELFSRPRPFVAAPDVVLPLFETDGFGFPSGHVGLSISLWGYIALYYSSCKNRWVFAVLGIYILLMAYARMVAGVHYPQDVIGGFLIGLALILFLYTNLARMDAAWSGIPVVVQAIIITVAGVVCAFLLQDDPSGVANSGIIIGGGLGAIVTHRYARYNAGGTLRRRLIRYIVGIVLTINVFIGLDVAFEPLQPATVFRVVRYAIVTFVILGLYPLLMLRFNLAEPETPPAEQAVNMPANQQT